MAKGKAKAKLPKRVAGIKIPKALRKNSGLLIQLLQTPQAKAAVASGLAAASAAIAGGRAAESSGMTATRAKRRLKFAAEEGVDQIAALADTVGSAVTASLERWFSHSERGPDAGKADKADKADKETKPSPERDRASAH